MQSDFDKGNDEAINKLLKIESSVLRDARDNFSLVSSNEFIDLKRLKDDRNRCAHPTFQRIEIPYYPTAEQARYHIKNSVLHVLSQPPVQGKYALKNLSKLIESKYFPENDADAQKQLEESEFQRPSIPLLRAFIEYLCFGFFDEKHPLYTKNKAICVIRISIKMHNNFAREMINVNLSKIIANVDDKNFALVAYFVSLIGGTWELLSESSQIKIKEFCKLCDFDTFRILLPPIYNIDDLRMLIDTRISNLSQYDIVLVNNWPNYQSCVDRSVSLFCTAGNWNQANSIYDTLIGYIFDKLSDSQIDEILRSPLEKNSDLVGSIGFDSFIDQLLSRKRFTLDGLRHTLREIGIFDRFPDLYVFRKNDF